MSSVDTDDMETDRGCATGEDTVARVESDDPADFQNENNPDLMDAVIDVVVLVSSVREEETTVPVGADVGAVGRTSSARTTGITVDDVTGSSCKEGTCVWCSAVEEHVVNRDRAIASSKSASSKREEANKQTGTFANLIRFTVKHTAISAGEPNNVTRIVNQPNQKCNAQPMPSWTVSV